MELTPERLSRLSRFVRWVGKRYGFLRAEFSRDDIIQEAWAGLLTVKEKPDESEKDLLARCRSAAKLTAIDALRTVYDTRTPHRTLLTSLVEDIEEFEDSLRRQDSTEARLELWLLTKDLPLREKVILWGLMRELSLREIGAMLGLTEGRIHQLRGALFAELRRKHQ